MAAFLKVAPQGSSSVLNYTWINGLWFSISITFKLYIWNGAACPPSFINHGSYLPFRRVPGQLPLNASACVGSFFLSLHVLSPIYRIPQRCKQDMQENIHMKNSRASSGGINPPADGLVLIPDQRCKAGCTTSSVLVKIASLFLISLLLIGSVASGPALLLSNWFALGYRNCKHQFKKNVYVTFDRKWGIWEKGWFNRWCDRFALYCQQDTRGSFIDVQLKERRHLTWKNGRHRGETLGKIDGILSIFLGGVFKEHFLHQFHKGAF